MRRLVNAVTVVILLVRPLASAQEAPPLAPGFRQVVEVRAVDIDVVATKGGKPVEDLTKEEMTIRVDGKPLPLDYFARVTAGALHGPDLATASPDLILETTKNDSGERYLPRQFLVYFDDAHLLPGDRNRAIEGLRDFITRLTPSDGVSLVSFGTTMRVIVPFTSSKEELLAGLGKLQTASPAGVRFDLEYRTEVQQALRARSRAERRAVISAWSQQALAREKGMLEELRRAVAALGALSGKRVLLLISNGIELHPGQTLVQALGSPMDQWDRSVVEEFRAVVAQANTVGVRIDAIDARGLAAEGDASSSSPSPFNSFLVSQNLREALEGFADGTGGILVANRNDFAAGLDRVYRESTTYYSVGVTLQNVDPRKKEHTVGVTTTRPGVVLRSRRAVSARTPDEAAKDRMEMALLNPDAAGDFPVSLTLGPPRAGGGLGHRLISYDVGIPVASATFRDEAGNRVAPLEISLAAVSDSGARSAITTQRVTANLGPTGTPVVDTWHLTGELKSGKGSFRFVATVRDLATDRVAVASSSVRVE